MNRKIIIFLLFLWLCLPIWIYLDMTIGAFGFNHFFPICLWETTLVTSGVLIGWAAGD